ncbi:MAG: hypothetical protein IJN83_03230, partial [Clostridia bacterium]|nr:hypothetical protein [Clostridia bacterium]
ADAALLAAKSKGLALSLTLSLRLFREKSRFATNFSRYTSLAGEAGRTLVSGEVLPAPSFTQLFLTEMPGARPIIFPYFYLFFLIFLLLLFFF